MKKKQKSILYLMHVSWGWIKQRPHFLAEGLSASYKVVVFYSGEKVNATQNDSLSIKPFPNLIMAKGNLTGLINYLFRRVFFSLTLRRYNIVWVTFPNQYALIRKSLKPKHLLIYDCMDDALELYRNTETNQKLFNLERELVQKASIIFVSADSLKQKLVSRYSINNRIHVVNNAIKNPDTIIKNVLPSAIASVFAEKTEFIKIVYLGTISAWMDFDLLMHSLKEFTRLQIILIGPCETNLPSHARLIWIKPIEHNYVFDLMQKADALIMPFVINNLILGVNPVKAYEYIYAGKPVILRSYPESQKFDKYVHLYENKKEFFSLISKLIAGDLKAKVGLNEAHQFAKENTWEKRMIQINEIMKNGI